METDWEEADFAADLAEALAKAASVVKGEGVSPPTQID